MSNNTITIPIGQREPGQFLHDLHEAISEVKMLVFERRELDLGEPQNFALHTLTTFQQLIVGGAKA
ncbi:MAG: hypothetical protein AAGN35_03975 [Bacteroidota bacterium]